MTSTSAGRCAVPYWAALPSRSSVTLTLSPLFNVLDFQPARTRNVGEVISTDQVTVPPFSFGTSTSIQECGLAHRNSLTVPLTVTDLVRSMPAAEWCADSGAAITSVNSTRAT